MFDATPLLRGFAGRRLIALALQDPLRAQRDTLAALVRRAAATQFGREHGFSEIRTIRDYQARVPLRDYEAFRERYWRAAFPVLRGVTWPGTIPAFALSSGTTSDTTKRIPVSREMMRCNVGAALDTLVFHLAARPDSRVFGGRNLLLGGSTALQHMAPGIVAGDLSGIAAARMPRWVRRRAFPPPELSLIGDWDAKIAALAPASLDQDIRSLSGTPSWMLLFFEQLAALRPRRPRRLAEFYPNLELLVHGGVSLAPYRDALGQWLEGGQAELREVYPASEGFIAVADHGPGRDMRLITDRGLFFEFVRPSELAASHPDRRWLGSVELGVEYALILTTNAGLWSYILGDTVMLTERDPPLLRITGRLAATLNGFGEHVIAHELDTAIAEAARAIGASVADYTSGPVFPPESRPRGGHLFIVELTAGIPGREAEFAAAIDAALGRLNADYAAHRHRDFGMLPPAVRLVPTGTFSAWMRRRGKLGGQNKVPRVVANPELL